MEKKKAKTQSEKTFMTFKRIVEFTKAKYDLMKTNGGNDGLVADRILTLITDIGPISSIPTMSPEWIDGFQYLVDKYDLSVRFQCFHEMIEKQKDDYLQSHGDSYDGLVSIYKKDRNKRIEDLTLPMSQFCAKELRAETEFLNEHPNIEVLSNEQMYIENIFAKVLLEMNLEKGRLMTMELELIKALKGKGLFTFKGTLEPKKQLSSPNSGGNETNHNTKSDSEDSSEEEDEEDEEETKNSIDGSDVEMDEVELPPKSKTNMISRSMVSLAKPKPIPESFDDTLMKQVYYDDTFGEVPDDADALRRKIDEQVAAMRQVVESSLGKFSGKSGPDLTEAIRKGLQENGKIPIPAGAKFNQQNLVHKEQLRIFREEQEKIRLEEVQREEARLEEIARAEKRARGIEELKRKKKQEERDRKLAQRLQEQETQRVLPPTIGRKGSYIYTQNLSLQDQLAQREREISKEMGSRSFKHIDPPYTIFQTFTSDADSILRPTPTRSRDGEREKPIWGAPAVSSSSWKPTGPEWQSIRKPCKQPTKKKVKVKRTATARKLDLSDIDPNDAYFCEPEDPEGKIIYKRLMSMNPREFAGIVNLANLYDAVQAKFPDYSIGWCDRGCIVIIQGEKLWPVVGTRRESMINSQADYTLHPDEDDYRDGCSGDYITEILHNEGQEDDMEASLDDQTLDENEFWEDDIRTGLKSLDIRTSRINPSKYNQIVHGKGTTSEGQSMAEQRRAFMRSGTPLPPSLQLKIVN